MKAIETEYNGYRFRSRLEARWAVYFDALGIKYEYEIDGYEVISGVWYLPDFFLPDWNCFVEVKPKRLDRNEFEKCQGLPEPCLLLDGSPHNQRVYYITGLDLGEPDCYARYINTEASNDWWGWVVLEQSAKKGRPWFIFGERPDDYSFDDSAMRKARSARFERGETPSPKSIKTEIDEDNAWVFPVGPKGESVNIKNVLGSGIIQYVGPVMAEWMCDQFGDGIVHILEYEPHRLIEIPGMGPRRLENVIESWRSYRGGGAA